MNTKLTNNSKIYRTFHSPGKIETRELTLQEIREFADFGDVECKRYLIEEIFLKARNTEEKLDIIAEFLGLKDPK